MENQDLKYDYVPDYMPVIFSNSADAFSESRFNIDDAPFEASEIRDIINVLKNQWLSETKIVSNPRLRFENDNFKKIVDLGYYALPFLVDDLESNSTDWFFALNAITKQNPIKTEHQGKYDLMKADWLEWINKNMKNQYGDRNLIYA